MATPILDVMLFYNDRLVDERRIRGPELVTVGEDSRATFAVDAPFAPAGVPLLIVGRDHVQLSLWPGMSGSLQVGGQLEHLDRGPEVRTLALGPGDRGVFRVASSDGGDVFIGFSMGQRRWRPDGLRAVAARWPRVLAGAFVASLVLQGAIVFGALWMMPPRTAATGTTSSAPRSVAYVIDDVSEHRESEVSMRTPVAGTAAMDSRKNNTLGNLLETGLSKGVRGWWQMR